MLPPWLTELNHEVVDCTRCPRLVEYRERIAREKRRAYRDCEYWGKPVPGFGDAEARVLVLGLAPESHVTAFHRRSVVQVHVPGAVRDGLCQSAKRYRSRRWTGADGPLHYGRGSLCPARQQAASARTGELRSLPRPRSGGAQKCESCGCAGPDWL